MNTESVFARVVLLPARIILRIVLSLCFAIMKLIEPSSFPKLKPTRRARREVNEVARQHCPSAKVFRFDEINSEPEHVWFIAIKTKTDEQCEQLRLDPDCHQRLRDALLRVGYSTSAVQLVFFLFESQGTVDRDFGGSWHDAMQ